ncbi:hypothetical protein NRY68_06645 [Acidithiobacillus ferrooxidans]|jgi:hypothetical protein|uniref:hypothetical protein n=1 Tax=Acidithiobacillus TaxID=119977 RepID=UPI00214989A4|nr:MULTISPECIES: hypothetical protein [Acidithiobacillus]MBW9250210.1 hypothetical protein [Acidithiobacillus ferriphilus]MBW9255079.1 hypothetical protein [Acidithiobacillus ferriphilus]MCR1345485.1 hypothetical protein [Acidithiobacillus ferrooxidans]MCR1355819.1 hypothetical protein [Acidithiobacillus ferrooxidans]
MNTEIQQKGVSGSDPDMEPRVITIAVLVPEGKQDRDQLDAALKMLAPYQIAMSLEDDMTILELIEEDDEFDSLIAERARLGAKELLLKAKNNGRHPWFVES